MSDRITDQLRLDVGRELLQSFRGRESKVQNIGPLSRLAAKLLTKQYGDVRFVVDNQDAYGHDFPLAAEDFVAPLPMMLRGKLTMNSVNAPTSLATLIVPPCSLVTIS